MESILQSVRSTKAADRKRVKSLREKYAFLNKGKHTVVVPHCSRSHFIIVVFVFNVSQQRIFELVDCYDLLHPDRQKTVKKNQVVGKLVNCWKRFTNLVLLNDKVSCDDNLNAFNVATFWPTPSQDNRYDCALFAFVFTLCLLKGLPVAIDSFTQFQVTTMIARMYHNKVNEKNGVTRHLLQQLASRKEVQHSTV